MSFFIGFDGGRWVGGPSVAFSYYTRSKPFQHPVPSKSQVLADAKRSKIISVLIYPRKFTRNRAATSATVKSSLKVCDSVHGLLSALHLTIVLPYAGSGILWHFCELNSHRSSRSSSLMPVYAMRIRRDKPLQGISADNFRLGSSRLCTCRGFRPPTKFPGQGPFSVFASRSCLWLSQPQVFQTIRKKWSFRAFWPPIRRCRVALGSYCAHQTDSLHMRWSRKPIRLR